MDGSTIEELVGEEKDVQTVAFLPLRQDTILQLFSDGFNGRDAHPESSLLAVNNSSGILVGASTSEFVIEKTENIRNSIKSAILKSPLISSTAVRIKVPGTITHIAFSPSGSEVFVTFEDGKIFVYDITAVDSKPKYDIWVSPVQDIQPNPSSHSDLVAVLAKDGSLRLLSISTRQLLDLLLTNVTAISWSPKGKQIVCGMKNGSLIQITPEGQKKGEIVRAPSLECHYVSKVSWLENQIFLVVYHVPEQDPSHLCHQYELYIISTEEEDSAKYIRMPDPAPPFGLSERGLCHFFLSLQKWSSDLLNLVIVSATPSADIGVIARSKSSTTWATWTISDETKRAFLPYSIMADHESSPLGLALDFTSGDPLEKPLAPNDEPLSTVPVPILYILNTDGFLSAYHILYVDAIKTGTRYHEMSPGVKIVEPAPTVKDVLPSSSQLTFGSSASKLPSVGLGFGFGGSAVAAPSSPFGSSLSTGQIPQFTQSNAGTGPTFGQSSFQTVTPSPMSGTISQVHGVFGASSSLSFATFADSAGKDLEESFSAKDSRDKTPNFGTLPRSQVTRSTIEKAPSRKVPGLESPSASDDEDDKGQTHTFNALSLSLQDKKETFHKVSARATSSSPELLLNPADSVESLPEESKDGSASEQETVSESGIKSEDGDVRDNGTKSAIALVPNLSSSQIPRLKDSTVNALIKSRVSDSVVQAVEQVESVDLASLSQPEECIDKPVVEQSSDNGITESVDPIDRGNRVAFPSQNQESLLGSSSDLCSNLIETNTLLLPREVSEQKDMSPPKAAVSDISPPKAAVSDIPPSKAAVSEQDAALAENSSLAPKQSEISDISKSFSSTLNTNDSPFKSDSAHFVKELPFGTNFDSQGKSAEKTHFLFGQTVPGTATDETNLSPPAPATSSFHSTKHTSFPVGKKGPHRHSSLRGILSRKPATESFSTFEEQQATETEEKAQLPVTLGPIISLDNIPEPMSLQTGLTKEFELVYLRFTQELELLGDNTKNLSHFIDSQMGKGDLCDLQSLSTWSLGNLNDLTCITEDLLKQSLELNRNNNKHDQAIHELKNSLIKLEAKQVEIARYIRAKTDPEFAKMVRARQLGPEHAEQQRQLRKSTQNIENMLQTSEEQLSILKATASSRVQGKNSQPSAEKIRRAIDNITADANRMAEEANRLERKLKRMSIQIEPPVSYSTPTKVVHHRDLLSTNRDIARSTAEVLNKERFCMTVKVMMKPMLPLRTEFEG